MEALGLVGPAAPWMGGIAQFTTTLAAQLRAHTTIRWLSWRVPRLLPRATFVEAGAVAHPGADPALDLYRPGSWHAAGVTLRGCEAVVLTLTDPLLLLPYRRLAGAYRASGGRIVLLCHNVLAHERRATDAFLASRVLRLADALVVHSRSDEAIARRLAPATRIVEAFHPGYAGRAVTPTPGARRLLFFGHVRSYKGLEDLLRALPLLPHATLHVAGRFEEPRRGYETLVRRLGLAGRVTLDDRYVPDDKVAGLFAAADVVVAPYREASQSGVAHLALSLGRPVAATAVGGLGEAIDDGRTGALAAPGDVPALAAAVERALALDPAEVRAAASAVCAERSWARYVELLDTALDPLADIEGGP